MFDGRSPLPNGTLLDGSYHIQRVIGRGGFGITYEADDIKLGTKVAVKEYCPEEFGSRDASLSVRPKSDRHTRTFEWGRSSFLEEARTLARFRHAGIVRVSRVFEAYSTAYMVMDFEQGQNLGTWLDRLGRPPSQAELDRIAPPLLDALELMHSAHFLHRDIAPDNIIIRSDGTPVLLDFGAARRAVAEASRSLTGIVKTGYSPQEQYAADSRLQGPWTDVYALGATLYKAVTGSAPEDATLRGIDDRLLRTDHAAKGSYRAGFMAAIDSCLMVNPADRPQSIAQLRQLLLAAAPPSTMQAETTMLAASPLAKLPDRPSRPAWWLLAAGFIAIVGGVYGGVQYSKWREEQATARNDDKGRTEDKASGKNYSKVGNFACFSEAEYPESWRAEAIFCAPYGCNFGKMSQDACLTLGATKRSKTVIHGNAGTSRSHECWLQISCGNLQPHYEFTLFRM